MSLWQAGLLAVLGTTVFILGIWRRKRKWMTAAAIAGALIHFAALTYISLTFVFLDAVKNQSPDEPADTASEITALPATDIQPPVNLPSPMPSDYDLPVSETPEAPDILELRDESYADMPTFGTQNEVSKFVLWNFLNGRFEFEFYLKKEMAPDEGTGFDVLHNACTSAMSYHLFGAYDMVDMFTEVREDEDHVYSRIKLVYSDPELDAEARAEAMEFVLKNPVPVGGFKDGESEKAYARKIHDFIAKKVTYSPKGYNPKELLSSNNYEALQEAFNVLGEDQDTVVCAGYARAFALIAQYAGINAVWVSGNETETESHAWNVIYPCDGSEPMLVDVTWDDTSSADIPGQEYVSDEYFYIFPDEDYGHIALDYMEDFLMFVNEP